MVEIDVRSDPHYHIPDNHLAELNCRQELPGLADAGGKPIHTDLFAVHWAWRLRIVRLQRHKTRRRQY